MGYGQHIVGGIGHVEDERQVGMARVWNFNSSTCGVKWFPSHRQAGHHWAKNKFIYSNTWPTITSAPAPMGTQCNKRLMGTSAVLGVPLSSVAMGVDTCLATAEGAASGGKQGSEVS